MSSVPNQRDLEWVDLPAMAGVFGISGLQVEPTGLPDAEGNPTTLPGLNGGHGMDVLRPRSFGS